MSAAAVFGVVMAFVGGCLWMDSLLDPTSRLNTTTTATIGTALVALGLWIAVSV